MENIYLTVAVIAVCCLGMLLLVTELPRWRKQRETACKASAIATGIALAAGLLFRLLLPRFAEVEAYVSPLSLAITVLIAFSGFVLPRLMTNEKRKKLLRRLGVLILVLFAAESFLFNAKSLTTEKKAFSADLIAATTETPESVRIEDGKVLFTGNGSVILPVNSDKVGALRLHFVGMDRWYRSTLEIKDGNFSQIFKNVGEQFATGDDTAEFSLHPYKTLTAVRISMGDVNDTVILEGCTFSSALPFRFSSLRFLTLFVLLGAVIAIVTLELYKKTYVCELRKHRLIVAATAVVCVLMTLPFYLPDQTLLTYSPGQVETQDPFVQMFDAVHSGRSSLAIVPSPELATMENPYDFSLRAALNIPTSWDRAYYNGKYYSYYGVAPVLVFYYPIHQITGKLPTLNMANVFFAALSALFLCGAITAFSKKFIKQPNFLLLLLSMVAACFASGTYALAGFSSLYTVPGLAGSCFLFLCLWTGYSGCNQTKTSRRNVLFAVCGIAFVLSVASRPTRAIIALVLAPVFLELLCSNGIKLRTRLTAAASFLAPVAAGLICIMLYNNARFGSPFEFGAVYQLTLSDVNANKLRLSMLPFALLHYFFQPVQFMRTFPFFTNASVGLSGYGQFVYAAESHGAFSYPLLLMGVIVLLYWFYHQRTRRISRAAQRKGWVKKYSYLLLLVFAVLLSWVDFCMAGVIFSYICDILPALTLLSVWIILDVQQSCDKMPAIVGKSLFTFSAVSVATILFGALELLNNYGGSISKTHPTFALLMEDLFCFWN